VFWAKNSATVGGYLCDKSFSLDVTECWQEHSGIV
jgi:hypothetical protein